MTKFANAPLSFLLCLALIVLPDIARAGAGQGPPAANGFRIVVIAGEDAVNVIQQRTAVAPIVEVRDRNNLPVAGVVVTFALGAGQGATFAGGASTLAVTTNAAGQAIAAGLTPTTAGAVTINASAVVQGQTIAATITQTNFVTAAQAAQAGAGASGGGGGAGAAGGAAGGGGGGLAGTTIGIIAGAAAAGTAVAVTAAGGGSSESGSTTSSPTSPSPAPTTTPTPTPAPTPTPTPTPTTPAIGGTYNGNLTGPYASNGAGCSITFSVSGPVRIVLDNRTDGAAAGTGTATLTIQVTSASCAGAGVSTSGINPSGTVFTGPVTGSASSLRFTQDITQTFSTPNGLGGTITVNARMTFAFSGNVNGNVITGTATMNHASTVAGPGGSSSDTGSGTFPMTLTK